MGTFNVKSRFAATYSRDNMEWNKDTAWFPFFPNDKFP